LSIYTQYPISSISECGAFYRIFFGQEYRFATGKVKVGCGVGVVVWKWVRRKRDTQCLQVFKVALRMSDAGDGMDFGFVKIIGSGCQAWIEEVVKDRPVEAHGMLARSGYATVHYHRIHRLQARGRFAQRSGGEQPAIAQPSLAIDDRDFDIALHAVVLQAVITQHHIALRVGLQCSARGGDAIPAHPDRAEFAPCHQQRLVASLLCGHTWIHPLRKPCLALVAAADYERMPALRYQLLRKGKCQRSLAGSADTDVAYHDDG